MRWGLWDGLRGRELELPLEHALDASGPGSNDSAVAYLCTLPSVKAQLALLSDSDLQDGLRETGAWDEDELQDRATNESRAVWLAAHDIREEEPEPGDVPYWGPWDDR